MGTEYKRLKNKSSYEQGSSINPKSLNKADSGMAYSPQSPLTQLQRKLGNQAMQKMFNTGAIQAKLKIGQPDDKYEQEADRVADQVMRMPDAESIQRCTECGNSERHTREEILNNLRRRVIERAGEKSIEIIEALRNGYIWLEVETAPGITLTVEVMNDWRERNQTLQQILPWLRSFIERIREGRSYNNLRPGHVEHWTRSEVQQGTYVSDDSVHNFFWGEVSIYLHSEGLSNAAGGGDRDRFIGRVLLLPPNRTSVLPPSLRTGQATPTPTSSGLPQPQPHAQRQATTQITDLWVEVPEPRAHPERVSGILTTYQAGFRSTDRPATPRFELFIVGGTYLYNRGDRRIWLPNLPHRFPSLRQRQQ